MKSTKYFIRKVHRYLGVIIGIQFFLWTIGGLYFSWTNIDHIHGDHLINFPDTKIAITKNLITPTTAVINAGLNSNKISKINLANVLGETVYRMYSDTNIVMINAKTGQIRPPLNKNEAINFAKQLFKPNNNVNSVEYITKSNSNKHSQYRGGPIPAWAISFNHPSNSVIYISSKEGNFETLRNQQWRLFDFLWMLHVMDFNTRENINNWLLRGFSILGLLTISSGFLLFYQSSKTIKKIKKRS